MLDTALEGRPLIEGLQQLVRDAAHLVPLCVGISATYRRDDLTFTFVRSSHAAAVLDAAQYLDDGPCEESARTGEEIRPDAGLLDETRWQLFAQMGAAHGVRSSLSLPLRDDGTVLGTVNFYGSTIDTFDTATLALAHLIGARVADAITNADLAMASADRARVAPDRLQDRAVVDQATGILMSSLGVGVTEATERLEQAASQAALSVSQLARAVIDSLHDR